MRRQANGELTRRMHARDVERVPATVFVVSAGIEAPRIRRDGG
ncbi:hypothetical protein BURMUCF1_A1015 [Burkholderia multivorans ATCC BAA-247]|nr:hypothetical protein BURMUCGD1_4582 [Burkholderia multivorans CGD1]EJO58599.1 hypothetical protein BURMUCF1_A1015 [Burkholderia multivorans ATCC BAA-247]